MRSNHISTYPGRKSVQTMKTEYLEDKLGRNNNDEQQHCLLLDKTIN